MKITTIANAATTNSACESSGTRNRSKGEIYCSRIFQAGSGRGLIKFCSELAVFLIRRYSVEDDFENHRSNLRKSLEATLKCSRLQADCVIDLSLEMIHAKVHGNYRRPDIELSYLIAIATGVVDDVSAN